MSGPLIGPGVFIAVAGPSGAGKDSVISYVRRHLGEIKRVQFARRVITRPSDPAVEDHDTLDEPAFIEAEAAGAYALSWRSHGLCYGIPVAVDETIRDGGAVVANVSRGLMDQIRRRYCNAVPVLITVTPDVLATRLARRGRETEPQIRQRLSHNSVYGRVDAACLTIDNSGPLKVAGEALLQVVKQARIAAQLRVSSDSSE